MVSCHHADLRQRPNWIPRCAVNRTCQQSGKADAIDKRPAVPHQISFGCSTMHERASSFLEGSEGFFCRNGRKYFDVVEWIFRLGR